MQDISHNSSTDPSIPVNQHFDVVVVGGGMIGAATAIGLGQLGLSVAVIDTNKPSAFDDKQPLDVRISALSVASANLLGRLGVMEQLLSMRHVAYTGLETWELDGFITQFSAEQISQDKLGYFFENRLIQLALWQQIDHINNVDIICPASVASITRDTQQSLTIKLSDDTELSTSLLVGADGANSQVRQWANIGVTGWDYGQWAMLINISLEEPIPAVTWQQFTPSGPRSLLPLPNNHASLVWYDSPSRIKQLMQLSSSQLAEQIKQHFPSRLPNNFTVVDKGSFPLTRRHAQQYYVDNVVIVGDAAHTINPLAGQGVNIGFKDVDVLVASVAKAIGDNQLWYGTSVLKQYQCKRYYDNQLMMTAMDAFYAGFSNDILPLKILRNGALKLANIDSGLKRKVLKYAIGID
ncbi:FAD-dependent monooxygenase [Shewanella intestini]|uniref:2-octaprenyl-3-methyl-6-methoxy-1,4-benzoquinol hydroxylase n=1 Tax=Shewanella intestini TaxID=2017544 RepID=A0ABS5I613_9GAMM|nr:MULTISPECIES: FAD-dependent monooxygenase [Shewanella]MBR9729454.1 2-octaprenyl-3-methyl-6-methoxy-1,4-benzoquinol hydroxylase [Shewanella intestini]MRG35085.1 2-octaprenyl-3-methyl-6-methoxy-1,4-benzoquinol hydroxylase [Shewanella sp. XMDDZSB0408]